jgi:hypothetical protein
MEARQAGMSQADATALWQLRAVWEDRYVIAYSGGTWRAARIGQGGDFKLLAKSAEALRNMIGNDYQQWQIEARRHNQ